MTQKTVRSSLPLLAPLLAGASSRDRLVASLGALLAITVVAALCHRLLTLPPGLPYLAAPLGASAVLVFAVPASPLSQPWAVIGGNIVSALIGTLAAQVFARQEIAAGAAVGGAILAMSLLRCFHAPGGGTALVTALAPPAIAASGYAFALWPVAIDAVLLDNMDVPTLKRAVAMVGGRATTEASGGVRLETVRKIAETGIDLISAGALTHSARRLDLSLEWARRSKTRAKRRG